MTRDSIILTLATIGSVVGYLVADGRLPTTWGYVDILKFVAFIIGIVSAKLATSPLRGDND